MKSSDALDRIINEYKDAVEEHGSFVNSHHGYGVMKEEFDELWDEIKRKNKGDKDKLRKEAAHIAATAFRFMVDLC